MEKTYRPYDPDQLLLLPPNLRDWLPREHLAYFVSDVVDDLDLSAILRVYEQEPRGYPPYHPALMVKVLLYGYAGGCAPRAAWRGRAWRMWASGSWRPTTRRTSGR